MPWIGWKAWPRRYASMYSGRGARCSVDRGVVLEGRALRRGDGAREDPGRVMGIGEEGVDLEDALTQSPLEVLTHLVEHGVHAVAVHGHRHAVRGVGDADGPPRRQPDADGLPAAREPADVVGVDVDGEVRIRHQP